MKGITVNRQNVLIKKRRKEGNALKEKKKREFNEELKMEIRMKGI